MKNDEASILRRGGGASTRWTALAVTYGGIVLAAGVLPAGCGRGNAENNSSRSGVDAPVPVVVARVVQEDVPIQVPAIGWVEGYAVVTVKARVEGQLTGVHFTKGQDLKAGDLLFTIDPRPFAAAVQAAESQLARDKALAEDAEKDAQWKADLFRQGTAAQREYDQSRAQAEALRATVRADEAALEKAKLELEYCTIRSPIDGRAGDLLVDRGNIVKANETALVVIEQVRPIYVAFSVPEHHVAAVKERLADGRLPVEATLPGEEGTAERGVLTFMDNRVDTATGTIRLKGTFQNEHRRLWPGQFVNVILILATERNAVLVPSQAIQTGQQGQFVFVVKADQAVELRPVLVGRTVGDRVVIQEGLKAGEIVVTDGQLRLVPGAKVDIKNPPTTTRTGSP